MTASLEDVLSEARRRGYLGDHPIEWQVAHACGFAAVCEAVVLSSLSAGSSRRRLIDLGSGAGLPGLVLVTVADVGFPETVLLEGSTRRAEWLRYAAVLLGLETRVEVLAERAEVAGRSPRWRGGADIVVARSCGAPAVTAELAAPLLRSGGSLVVSEPPPSGAAPRRGAASGQRPVAAAMLRAEASMDLRDRWPMAGLAKLGFGSPKEWEVLGFRYAQLRLDADCPDRYPRRTGIPHKRPLF